MSCTAINSKTREVWEIAPGENIRETHTADAWLDMVCPISGAPVIPVKPQKCTIRGVVKSRAHWRIKELSTPWPDDVIYDPELGNIADGVKRVGGESNEHHFAKQAIRDHLVSKYARQGSTNLAVRLEHRLMIGSLGKYRIADVCVLNGDTPIEVYEIQLSPITPEEIIERSNDYESLGIDSPVWAIGPKLQGQPAAIDAISLYCSNYMFIDIGMESNMVPLGDPDGSHI